MSNMIACLWEDISYRKTSTVGHIWHLTGVHVILEDKSYWRICFTEIYFFTIKHLTIRHDLSENMLTCLKGGNIFKKQISYGRMS